MRGAFLMAAGEALGQEGSRTCMSRQSGGAFCVMMKLFFGSLFRIDPMELEKNAQRQNSSIF
jgi:hypothetical protein